MGHSKPKKENITSMTLMNHKDKPLTMPSSVMPDAIKLAKALLTDEVDTVGAKTLIKGLLHPHNDVEVLFVPVVEHTQRTEVLVHGNNATTYLKCLVQVVDCPCNDNERLLVHFPNGAIHKVTLIYTPDESPEIE